MSVAIVTVRGVEVPVEFDFFLATDLSTQRLIEEVEWFPSDQEQFDRLFGTLTIAEQEDIEAQLHQIEADRCEMESFKFVDA